MSKSKSGGGARKIGRNQKWCNRYAASNRLHYNRERRARRHAKRVARQRAKAKLRALDKLVNGNNVATNLN